MQFCCAVLHFLNIFLTLLHLAIIGFNLLAWIWPRTRRAHLIVAGLTLASWFVLGIWYGIGYCPLTDWHWRVKQQLGEHHLPASYITYYAEWLTGRRFSSSLINAITLGSFLLAILFSVYFNFFRRKNIRLPLNSI